MEFAVAAVAAFMFGFLRHVDALPSEIHHYCGCLLLPEGGSLFQDVRTQMDALPLRAHWRNGTKAVPSQRKLQGCSLSSCEGGTLKAALLSCFSACGLRQTAMNSSRADAEKNLSAWGRLQLCS